MDKSKLFKDAHALAREWGKDNGDYRCRFALALKQLYAIPHAETLAVKIVGEISLNLFDQRDPKINIVINTLRKIKKTKGKYLSVIQMKVDRLASINKAYKERIAYQSSHNQLANQLNKSL